MTNEEIYAWMKENLKTTAEAKEITEQSKNAFAQSVSTNQIKPFFESSEGYGAGKVRLYLKSDLEKYRDKKQENRNKKKTPEK